MVAMRAHLLSRVFGLGDPVALDAARWVEGLDVEQSWRVLGELSKLGLADNARRDATPSALVHECLTALEREVAEWMRRPFDVFKYFVVCNAVRASDPKAARSFWSETHHAVWSAVQGTSPNAGSPSAIRVFILVEDSPSTLMTGYLEPAARSFLRRVASDPERSRRLVAWVESSSTSFRQPIGVLLGDVVADFQQLRRESVASLAQATEWKRRAKVLLLDLEATLPQNMREERANWFGQLRRAIDEYRMPPSPPEPQVRYGDVRTAEYENEHFLNNWD